MKWQQRRRFVTRRDLMQEIGALRAEVRSLQEELQELKTLRHMRP